MKLIPTSLTRYSLDPAEEVTAATLTTLQKAALQNLIASVAETILNLTYDPQNPQKFIQNDAFNKGQKAAYQFLLDSSDAAEAAALKLTIDSESNPSST
jgi:hypothetical protein